MQNVSCTPYALNETANDNSEFTVLGHAMPYRVDVLSQ